MQRTRASRCTPNAPLNTVTRFETNRCVVSSLWYETVQNTFHMYTESIEMWRQDQSTKGPLSLFRHRSWTSLPSDHPSGRLVRPPLSESATPRALCVVCLCGLFLSLRRCDPDGLRHGRAALQGALGEPVATSVACASSGVVGRLRASTVRRGGTPRTARPPSACGRKGSEEWQNWELRSICWSQMSLVPSRCRTAGGSRRPGGSTAERKKEVKLERCISARCVCNNQRFVVWLNVYDPHQTLTSSEAS